MCWSPVGGQGTRRTASEAPAPGRAIDALTCCCCWRLPPVLVSSPAAVAPEPGAFQHKRERSARTAAGSVATRAQNQHGHMPAAGVSRFLGRSRSLSTTTWHVLVTSTNRLHHEPSMRSARARTRIHTRPHTPRWHACRDTHTRPHARTPSSRLMFGMRRSMHGWMGHHKLSARGPSGG